MDLKFVNAGILKFKDQEPALNRGPTVLKTVRKAYLFSTEQITLGKGKKIDTVQGFQTRM